jgi:hypothetical protein
MRYALPIALVVCLAALWLVSPLLEPRRVRLRAARVTEDLRDKHGFREGSKAAWAEARSTNWPPFHYGTHQTIDNELIGTLYELPTRVAGYELVTNGSRHRYGLAAVVLPRPLEWMEVRGERPFTAAKVPDHVPDGRLGDSGIREFDAAWTVYADTQLGVMTAGSRRTAETMITVPTALSWRTHNNELLLWKRDGWDSATQLITSLSIVMNLLELTELGVPDLGY